MIRAKNKIEYVSSCLSDENCITDITVVELTLSRTVFGGWEPQKEVSSSLSLCRGEMSASHSELTAIEKANAPTSVRKQHGGGAVQGVPSFDVTLRISWLLMNSASGTRSLLIRCVVWCGKNKKTFACLL